MPPKNEEARSIALQKQIEPPNSRIRLNNEKKEAKTTANRIDNGNSRMDTYYSTMGQSTLNFNKTAITIDSLDF